MALRWYHYAGIGVGVVAVGYGLSLALSNSAAAPVYQPQVGSGVGGGAPAINPEAEIARGAFGVVDRLIGVVGDKVARDDTARQANHAAKNDNVDESYTVDSQHADAARKRAAA